MIAPDKSDTVYQFRISLKHITPMIWRRVLLLDENTLKDLHYVIQIIMGWTDYHLNEFKIHGKRYSIPNSIGTLSGGGHLGNQIKLNQLGLRLNQKFSYAYDFTANWEFEIRLEKRLLRNEKKTYPICLSGSGASPDEECGGPKMFEQLKEHWSFKCKKVALSLINAILDEDNTNKPIGEVLDRHQIRQALYWLNIAKYERRQVNKYLKYYAKEDERWLEAFDEVIYL